MPNRKISNDLKERRAVVLIMVGWEAEAVAGALGVSERSVKRWTERMACHGTLKYRSTLTGRPRILHGETLEYVRDLLHAPLPSISMRSQLYSPPTTMCPPPFLRSITLEPGRSNNGGKPEA
ncbi:hypothetical protein C8Q80DRAFT_1195753 [Daedaleopsis nitida]|nr:hypothetical protein C8Q80DRAFT_1195753 [Daedaleopsis nitida]